MAPKLSKRQMNITERHNKVYYCCNKSLELYECAYVVKTAKLVCEEGNFVRIWKGKKLFSG